MAQLGRKNGSLAQDILNIANSAGNSEPDHPANVESIFDTPGTDLSNEQFATLTPDSQFTIGYDFPSLNPAFMFNKTKQFGEGSVTVPKELSDATFRPRQSTMGVEETKQRLGDMVGSDVPLTLDEALSVGSETTPISKYDMESSAREARIDDRPEFGQPYSNRQPDVMSMEQAVRLAGGNRRKARSMIELQRMGRDPISGFPVREEELETGITPMDVANIEKTRAQTDTERIKQAKLLRDIDQTIDQKSKELNLTEAEKSRDKKFGQELAKWESTGAANTRSNIDSLNKIIGLIDEGQIKTGGFVDALPFGSDWARAIVNPQAQDALDRVRGVVFQSLRETLGAQFTEREGQRFVEASYNPMLSQDQNADRLRDYVLRLESAEKARNQQLQYLKENGTLQGYNGQDPEQVMMEMLGQGEGAGSSIRGDVDVKGDIDSIVDKY